MLGFKCFLVDSGSEEFPPIDVALMEQALVILRELDSPLLVHAENALSSAHQPAVSSRKYADYLRSRPRGIENLAVAEVIEAARRTGAHAHVCHLSSSDALPMIESRAPGGVSVTAESCPHYLALCAEEIGDGETACKCGPPIREAANRELLWNGLKDNVLDLIVSDHSPCVPDLKRAGPATSAQPGVVSPHCNLPYLLCGPRRELGTARSPRSPGGCHNGLPSWQVSDQGCDRARQRCGSSVSSHRRSPSS